MGDMTAEQNEADMGRTKNTWWKGTIYGLDIGVGVLTAAAAALFVVYEFIKKPKAELEPVEANGEKGE